MSDQLAIVTQAAITGGGPGQDFTDPSITDATTFVIWTATGATAADTNTDDAIMSIGFSDAHGNNVGLCWTADDAVATSDLQTQASTDHSVLIRTGAGTADGHAQVSAMIAGGATLTWTDLPAVARLISAVIGAGFSDAQCGRFAATTTPGNETVGFQADFIIFASGGNTAAIGEGTANADAEPSFGVVVRTDLVQKSIYNEWNQTGAGTTDADSIIETAFAAGEILNGAKTGVSITAIGATTFTRVAENATTTPDVIYLAVKFARPRQVAAIIESFAGTTGFQSFTQAGFPAYFVFGGANLLTATDTLTDGATASTFAQIMALPGVQRSHTIRHQEGISPPTDATSRSSANPLVLYDHLGNVATQAAFVSADAQGFTWNFSSATAGTMVLLVIGAPPQVPIPRRRKPRRAHRAAIRPRRPQIPLGKAAAGFVSLLKHFVRQRLQRVLRLRQPRRVFVPTTEEIERVSADEQGVIQEGGAVRGGIFEGGAVEGIIQE